VSVTVARGHNPAGVITEREYELWSRGPAFLSNTALDRYTSGSSSGLAALVSLGLCSVAVGTDSGGLYI
jgi:Asp-tRNA(Asn)/Glu-tRNA(Gln) amidotransferase A subunit family amidase